MTRRLGDDDSLLQIAGKLETEARGIVEDIKHRGKRVRDVERRVKLPLAASCYAAADALRKVVEYRRAS